MRVLLGDAAVRRPARVAEPVVRRGPVRPRCVDEVLEVADGAHVVEPVVLAQRDAGGVVAAVLEAAQPLEQQRLRLSVPTYPMIPHTRRSLFPLARRENSPKMRRARLRDRPQRRGRSAELLVHKRGDPSTEGLRPPPVRASASTRTTGSVPGRPHEHAPRAVQLVVQRGHRVEQGLRQRATAASAGGSAWPAGTLHHARRLARAAALKRVAQQQTRGEPVAGDVAAQVDDVPGLLAAEDAALA